MIATSRLFWIEIRRSVGLIAFPVLAALAGLVWFIQHREEDPVITLWPEASVDIGFMAVLVGPAAGGLAAWAASRDRRFKMTDLLATMPIPASKREVNLLAATASWAFLAYLVAGVAVGVFTAFEATWGGPVAAPILIGATVILASAAIGYAAGSLVRSSLPSRFMAGLVPVVLFFIELVLPQLGGGLAEAGPGRQETSHPYENLSPVGLMENIGVSVFWAPHWDIVWPAIVWFVGIGGLALAFVALRHNQRSPVALSALAVAVVAIVIGWTHLVPSTNAYLASPTKAIAYEPVCVQRSISICLHPAYQSVLDETADLIEPIVRPLVGLPGFPSRAEQPRSNFDETLSPFREPVAVAPDTLPIAPTCSRLSRQSEATVIALAAVGLPTMSLIEETTRAQNAIAVWLLRQAGWESMNDFEISTCIQFGVIENRQRINPETLLAADRFGALSPDERQQWLETNLAALRDGTLTLEDLP